ncbi:MAG TPA: hypothetical protein VFL77_06515 [Solirubrobacterales bacterium]|nr:hypothetical protein [Solirubrobacterales bacterium]
MNKIMLLAVTAAVGAAFALPTMAMAEDIPVHLIPRPEFAGSIQGSNPVLETVGGLEVKCEKITGSVSWESSTTGSLNLSFQGNCIGTGGVSCSEIKTSNLPFHFLTMVDGTPGVLITPSSSGVFAKFTCSFLTFEIKGNGLVGTAVASCGGSTSSIIINFEELLGTQLDRQVKGTETIYHLTANSEEVGLKASVFFSFGNLGTIECT